MYKRVKYSTSTIDINTAYEGESIEQKIDRIVNNKEPITDGAPLIYTDRKEGVKPEYDIRTDRFELAVEAMDTVAKSNLAKREERIKQKDDKKAETKEPKKGENGRPEPIQGTDKNPD